MIKIGLTGSIGMGKSTVAAMFARAGVPVFDADAVVHRLQAKDGALLPEIGRRFAGTVKDGTLDRDALAKAVLADPGELSALEAIVHPAVQRERERFVAEHRDSPALLFDVPLLFETSSESAFDKVVTVSAPPEVQRARVLKREGMTEERLAAILSRQLPDADKRRRADWVVDTRGSMEETEAQVNAILALLGLSTKR